MWQESEQHRITSWFDVETIAANSYACGRLVRRCGITASVLKFSTVW